MADLSIDSDFSENSDTQSDADCCNEAELENTFKETYSIAAEKALTLKKNYILHISCSNEIEPKIGVGFSNNVCEVHSLANNQIQKIRTIDGHRNNIVDVKFSSDSNLLYTGSSDCNIKLWDLRTSSDCALQFIDNSAKQGENKPLLSFDLSANNRVLCGGTELYENDAFLLFWDIRNAKILGGYWESHTDDVTTVLFHPTDSNKLASGSTDGLVNIYDLRETNEDDALLNSLNTNSSVEQIQWYGPNFEGLCSVTHTVDMQLWDVEEATTIKEFKRDEIAQSMKRKSSEHCYVASTHYSNENNELLLLTGSNWNKGECVRALGVRNNETLFPSFKLENNKQRIRASWMDNYNKLLITGGEQSILSVWTNK